MLEFELDTIEGVDETISKFYSQDEESGKYYLKVNGAVAKSKLKEFRDKNI